MRTKRFRTSMAGLLLWMAVAVCGPAPADAWVAQTHFGEGVSGTAEDVVVQPDGKIIALGYTATRGYAHPKIGVARYLPDGSPDLTFGARGRMRFDANNLNFLWNSSLQPDGKILVLWEDQSVRSKLRMTRVNSDGTLDREFGQGGTSGINYQFEHSMSIDHVDVDQVGRILVAGTGFRRMSGRGRWRSEATIWRMLPDGSRDRSFDGDGVFRRIGNWSRRITGVLSEPDGTITLIGSTAGKNFVDSLGSRARATMMKLTEFGDPDLSFNETGIKLMPAFGSERPDSSFPVCQIGSGTFDSAGRAVTLAMCFEKRGRRWSGMAGVVARYLPNGIFDPEFNGGKPRILRAPSFPFWGKIAVAPDDSLVLAATAMGSRKDAIVLAGLEESGATTPGFGRNGVKFVRGKKNLFFHGSLAAGPDGELYAGTTRPLETRKDGFEIFSLMSIAPSAHASSNFGAPRSLSGETLKRLRTAFNREDAAAHRGDRAARSAPRVP